jgi:Tol biopolymer transport system component
LSSSGGSFRAWTRRHPAGGLLAAAAALATLFAAAAPAEAAFPGANGKIAFQTNRDAGNYEIYSMNPDGSGQTRLTNNAALDWNPAWSPDGTKIAFMSTRTGAGDIYKMNADGTNVVRLTTTTAPEGAPSWSPNGTKIAFDSQRDGDAEIYEMNADGTSQTRITTRPGPDVDPAWSPDGTRIAFNSDRLATGNQDVYVMNADGTNVSRVTSGPTIDDLPNWSPDGTKIAFRSNRDSPEGNTEVYVINPDGSGETKISNSTSSDDSPAWSPDGNQIAFNSQRDGGNAQIYAMNADGTNPTRLTSNGTVADTSPDWQPAAYDVPRASNVTSVALVPAFRQTIGSTQCGATGRSVGSHGAPLSLLSCNPPSFVPGTAAHIGRQATGAATYTVVPGNPATVADEADVSIVGSVSDLHASSATGADYNPDVSGPDVTLVTKFRISDALNGASLTDPGTVSDVDFAVAMQCVETPDPSLGSTCSISTSADGSMPGVIKESRRMVLQLMRVRLNDSGPNGVRGDGDDKNFAQQGFYVP